MIEHLGDKVQVAQIFECVVKTDAGKFRLTATLTLILSLDLIQCVLLHNNVSLFPERSNFLHRADLESKVDPSVTLVFDLEDLREITITKLLNHLEIISDQCLLIGLDKTGDLLLRK